MGREDFSQSSQLSTLVGKPTNRYQRLPKNLNTLRNLTGVTTKLNNRYHYSIYPLVQKEYQASYTQLTNLDFYSPIITLRGLSVVSHLIGTVYEDAGATVDEGSTLISTESTVDDTKFGSYTVTYTSSDGINPDTTAVRVVRVGLPPDVTINGANPYNLEKFDVFVDPGITINDSNSSLISTTSTVNNIVVGVYTVNYTVSNPVFTDVFSRTVRVRDTTPPVITISGDNPYTLERFSVYTDPGATVDIGSELTNTNLDAVQNTAIGSFDVVYTAYDGNTTVTATRTVNVVDTVPPVITILGDNPYTLERFDVYTDDGATVDFGSTLTTDLSSVNNALVHGSSFLVTYTATDGNTAHDVTQTRTVNIVDTKPPVITLLGDNPYEIQPAIPFQDVDPGFEVDLGTSVTVDYSNVVTIDNSNFNVVYRASDGVNPDIVVIRRVAVADTLSPIITIIGDNPLTLERYTVYNDQGVTLDPGSSLVSTVSTVDNTTVGSYTITYVATDNINPDTIARRIVNVVDTTAPIVTLNGASSVTLERYSVFADIDPGVTIDANGTLTSVDISQLDNTTQGTYTVTYNVVDDHNNANVITREVVVRDTVPPVVTLNNESTFYTLERYGDWSAIDPGVTIDAGSYLDSVTVDNTSTGLKVVAYTVKDGTNTTQINRVISVVDTTPPVGSINNASYQLERLGVYTEYGVTGLDVGTYLAGIDTSNVDNTLSPGSTFDVVYDLGDGTNNTYLTRTVTIIDTTAPVITLSGDNPYTVERGTTYVDPGATADTGETVTVNTSQLNMAVSETYTVTYSATDADGNIGTVSRTVIVEDTTAPVITLANGDEGTTTYTVERGTTYVDPGATADTGETVTVNTSQLNMAVSDTYTVTYSATDAGGNTGTASRTVIVEDTIAPVITLVNGDEGTTNYTVERGTTYVDPGATADGGETVTVDTSELNMAVSDTYTVTYSATDADGNIGTASRTVIVEDNTAPVITLANGDEGTTTYTVEKGTTYVDPGATTDTGETVTVNTSQLNMAVPDTYTVTYSATDAGGNTGTASRTVIVEDTIAPVITLVNGDEGTTNYTVERGTTYVDPGATADGGETVTVDTSELNMAVSDTYTVGYSATDADGNIGTASRTVIVEDTTAPVITLANGDEGTTNYTVERGTTYVDPGATADTGETVTVDTSELNMAVSETYTVTYSATDADGNIGTASRTVIVEDTIAPTITLIDPDEDPITVERYSTYIDPGATTNGDGDVVVSSTVNTSIVDSYTVTYSATDADGNQSQASRGVNVVDTKLPVASLVGANSITVERYSVWEDVDPGLTDFDEGSYLDYVSGFDNTVVSVQLVTYHLSDGVNSNTITRAVTVQDTTAPVITLANGDEGTTTYTVERGTTYVDPGATADTGETVTVNTSQLNMAVSDTYTVTYSATDADGNIGTASRTVIVEDTIAPVITLANGDEGTTTYTVERGTTYVDPGATADGGETVTVDTSELNMAVSDTYTVTYSATDVDGNTGTASRTVIVEDTIAPVITLVNGDEGTTDYTVEIGTAYVDPGASTDTGELVTVNTSGLNMAVSGTYTVTYSATDLGGNTGTASRTVIVERTVQVKLTASDAAAGDFFGRVAGISGDYAIVGASRNDTFTGSAYIFHRTGRITWDAGTKIIASGGYQSLLGRAAGISGDYAIVGDGSGSANIFRRTGTNEWNDGTSISASDAAGGDQFGFSVAISGDYAIVGAPGNDDGGGNSGSAYIFRRTATNTWDAGTKIVAFDDVGGDRFGTSVAIDGDYAIVGTYHDNVYTGAAYIFRRTDINTWDAGTKIVASDKMDGDQFGYHVAISGDYAIVGAIGTRPPPTYYSYTGAAYIFRRTDTNTWDAGTKIVASDAAAYDYFGTSVGIDGDTVIVGARETWSDTGSAYIFRRTDINTWDNGTKIVASDAAVYDEFGYSVAIDGDYAIVGATKDDSDTGSAYIFDLTP
jgi:hypothetical protein